MENNHQFKTAYFPPTVEITGYRLEKGFAVSVEVTLKGKNEGGLNTTKLSQETYGSGEWMTEESDMFKN